MLRGRYTKVLLIAAIALALLITAIVIHSTRGTNSEIEEVWRVQIPGASLGVTDPIGHIRSYRTDAIVVQTVFKALRVYDLRGNQIWEFSANNYQLGDSGDLVMGYCIGADGSMYIGTDKNIVYAIAPDFSLRWLVKAPGDTRDWSCQPLVATDGTVYVVADEEQLYAFDSCGNQLWHKQIKGVSGTGSPLLSPTGTIYLRTENLELVAIASDGNEMWRTGQGTVGIDRMVLAADGTVICPRIARGYINAFNPDGTLRWSLSHGGRPSYGGGRLIATGSDSSCYYSEELSNGNCRLIAVDADGNQNWEYRGRSVLSDPAMLHDGRLVCLSTCITSSKKSALDTALQWLNKTAGRDKARLFVFSQNGRVTARKETEFYLWTTAPTVTPSSDILILDEQGILHCYRP